MGKAPLPCISKCKKGEEILKKWQASPAQRKADLRLLRGRGGHSSSPLVSMTCLYQ